MRGGGEEAKHETLVDSISHFLLVGKRTIIRGAFFARLLIEKFNKLIRTVAKGGTNSRGVDPVVSIFTYRFLDQLCHGSIESFKFLSLW